MSSALREAKAERRITVEFVWGGLSARLPFFLRTLEEEGIIEVKVSRGDLPFVGRLIDDKVVEIYRDGNGDIAPRGTVLRTRRAAPGIAIRLTDLAHAA